MSEKECYSMERCPFCGKKRGMLIDSKAWLENLEHVQYTVVCDASAGSGGCGASCGWRLTPREAVEAWNKRIFLAEVKMSEADE